MERAGRLAFLLAFAFLATHEMDAVYHAEWRVLPLLSWLEEPSSRIVFTLVHVPLFAGLAYLFWEGPGRIRAASRLLFSAFCVVHVGLHWAFSGHPSYSFDSWDANLLIIGAGVCGAAHLLTAWTTRRGTQIIQ